MIDTRALDAAVRRFPALLAWARAEPDDSPKLQAEIEIRLPLITHEYRMQLAGKP